MTKWTAKTCETIREHPAPRGQKEGTPLFSGAPSWFSMKKSVCGICVVRWKGQIFAQFFRNKINKNSPFLLKNGEFLVRVAGFEFPTRNIQPCFVGLFFLNMPIKKPFLCPFLPICYDLYNSPFCA